MTSPPRPPSDVKSWRADVVISPYHWVASTEHAEYANMELKTGASGTVKFPMLVNSKAIPVHSKLVLYKPKQLTVALTGAISVSSTAKPAVPKSGQPPIKKQKKDK